MLIEIDIQNIKRAFSFVKFIFYAAFISMLLEVMGIIIFPEHLRGTIVVSAVYQFAAVLSALGFCGHALTYLINYYPESMEEVGRLKVNRIILLISESSLAFTIAACGMNENRVRPV